MANLDNVSNRIKKLEEIERKITTSIQSAGTALQELSKEKPIDKHLEKQTTIFMQSLDEIETEMANQISYLSQVATNQQHEGSSYTARKKSQLLHELIAHTSDRMAEMVDVCEQYKS